MSGIAGSEVFLLIIIGLVVLGPKRLPQVANQIGSWLGQARRMTRMMKRQLEDEVNVDLNSINIKQQLGLDDKPEKPATSAVTTPTYVHDRHKSKADNSNDDAASESTQSNTDSEADELPDDYSPAHGVDDTGTGVGDGDGDGDGDEQNAVASTDSQLDDTENTAEESAAAPAADKKETA